MTSTRDPITLFRFGEACAAAASFGSVRSDPVLHACMDVSTKMFQRQNFTVLDATKQTTMMGSYKTRLYSYLNASARQTVIDASPLSYNSVIINARRLLRIIARGAPISLQWDFGAASNMIIYADTASTVKHRPRPGRLRPLLLWRVIVNPFLDRTKKWCGPHAVTLRVFQNTLHSSPRIHGDRLRWSLSTDNTRAITPE